MLREALQRTIKWRLLIRNPADAAEPPRPEKKEIQALDESQTAALLAKAEGSRFYGPILIAVTCGVRRGELLALRWQDADLSARKISVMQSLETTRDGIRFKPPKTARGRRSIALPQIAVDALRKHRAEQNKERLLFGKDYQDNGLIFAMPDGSPWAPDKFTSSYVSFTRRVGLKVRFHDLRHSHATQLLRQGIHPKIVSERLGHSTIGITLDTYSHVLPGMQEEAAGEDRRGAECSDRGG